MTDKEAEIPEQPDHSLDVLIDFLDLEPMREGCMSMSMLDGLVTSIAIGPAIVEPEEWLPLVFGGVDPGFVDDEHEHRIIEAILSYYEDSRGILREDPEEWEPWLTSNDDPAAEAEEWATGFKVGVGLREQAWGEALEDETIGTAFIAVMALAGFDPEDSDSVDGELTAEDIAGLQKITEKRSSVIDMLPMLVHSIAEYWQHKRRTPARRVKVGRNDACPCGSGKKYKRCCGMN